MTCQPGVGATNVRDATLREVAARRASPLGETIGGGSQSTRVVLDCEERELPLGAIYFLEHGGEGGELRFEQIADPYLLLASTFNFVIRTPERLSAQLDSCARIASGARLYRVVSPRSATAAALARALERHALRVLDLSPAP